MFSESACQVSCRWDGVVSFYARLCGVVYVTRGGFGNGCSSSSASALNFVSSPPTMKRSCLGSLLVMRDGYTVTTETKRQSSQWKAPRHQVPKRRDGWKAISSACSSLSLTSRGLCIKNSSQEVKLWIPRSTAKFRGDCVKKCEDIVPNFGENRPAPGCQGN